MEIIEIEINKKTYKCPEPCSFDITNNDFTNNEFDIDKWTKRTGIVEVKIYLLKQKLANTDYKAIKYAEGELSYSEYEPVRKQRREWRAEINQLEQLNG